MQQIFARALRAPRRQRARFARLSRHGVAGGRRQGEAFSRATTREHYPASSAARNLAIRSTMGPGETSS